MKQKKQQSSVSLSKESTPALYDDYRKKIAEETKIRKYVLEKPLNRPRTNWLTIVCIIALYVIISFFFAHILIWFLKIKKWRVLIYLLCYLILHQPSLLLKYLNQKYRKYLEKFFLCQYFQIQDKLHNHLQQDLIILNL